MDRAPDRSRLRIADLKTRREKVVRMVHLNIDLPEGLANAVSKLATRRGITKSQTYRYLIAAGIALVEQERQTHRG